MRIIAGDKRGMILVSPEGKNVRPTHDKVREAVFGRLQFFIQKKRFLDLFAGSGAMGIEALSRGAEFSVFVDDSKASLNTVKKNISKAGYENRCDIIHGDYLSVLSSFFGKTKFDCVFIDPPYASGYYTCALDALVENDILNCGAVVIVESDGPFDYGTKGLRTVKSSRYGKCCITYLEKNDEE